MPLDPTKIDWDLSDAENARRLLCHPTSVQRLRKSLGIDPVMPHVRVDWGSVDWTQTDGKIARAVGCSVGAVSSARKRLGKPKVRAFKTDWKAVDWSLSNTKLAYKLGVGLSIVIHRRARHAKGSKKVGRPRLLTQKQANQLSERKTVHEWLTQVGIPSQESGKPICLLRRLSITCDRLRALQKRKSA